MVNGLFWKMTPERKYIMAVDLDNTLVRGNTLHIYIKEGLKFVSLPGRLAILCLLALRRLRLISHRTMKFGCLRRIDASNPALRQSFTKRVKALLNPVVTEMIRKFNGTVLLASAAPDVYIPWIWDGPFLATRTADNPHKTELRGQAKADAVALYAREHSLSVSDVVTDHSDDIPLMLLPGVRVFLVNPTPKTLARLPQLQNLTII